MQRGQIRDDRSRWFKSDPRLCAACEMFGWPAAALDDAGRAVFDEFDHYESVPGSVAKAIIEARGAGRSAHKFRMKRGASFS